MMPSINRWLLCIALLAAAGCAHRPAKPAPRALVDEEHLLSGGLDVSTKYDEAPHSGCCSSALLNPGVPMNMV
jgi:hypothetical protein